MLVVSVAVGVMILTTALSLTNGFEADLVGKILGTTPHVAVMDPMDGRIADYQGLERKLAALHGVQMVLPYVTGQGLVTANGLTTGALVRGVDPDLERHNPQWTQFIARGSLEPDAAMLGTELARKLGVGVGDRIRLVTGIGVSRTFRVSGLYQAGLYEYDAHVLYLPLATAQGLYGLGQGVSGLELRLDDVFQAPYLARRLQAELPYEVRSWTTANHSLLAAMALEKRVIFLVVLFIVVVATMGVANTLAMWVLERNREMGLLRAMGMAGRELGWLVTLEGALVGSLGVVFGTLGGLLASLALATFPLSLPSDVYYIDRLPVQIRALDFLLVAACALIITWLACLLPSRRARSLDPVEVIRRT